MDLYAMQMSPHKKKDEEQPKEELKKIKEHVFSKEDPAADFSREKNAIGNKPQKNKILSPSLTSSFHISYYKPEQEEDYVEAAKEITPVKAAQKEKKAIASKPKKQEKTFSKTKAEISSEKIWDNNAKQAPKKMLDSVDKSAAGPGEDGQIKPEITLKESVSKIKKVAKEKVNFFPTEAELEAVRSVKPANVSAKSVAIKKETIEEDQFLSSREETILKNFVVAVRADNQKNILAALEELTEFRSENPLRCEAEYRLNVEIKEKLIASIPALFGYNGGRSVIHVLQLLDELNIPIDAQDLSSLPTEILKSQEMRLTTEKYLLWCAQEYSRNPGDLERRLAYFVRSGILSYVDLPSLTELHKEIFAELLEFVKENIKNPLEVEHKIYEYALAGFISGKDFKKDEKVRGVVRRFLGNLIEKNQENPKVIEKRIGDYEKTGLLSGDEIMKDERIQKIIEKFLLKFAKANVGHPRKVSAKIREYFDIGLIDKQTRDRFFE